MMKNLLLALIMLSSFAIQAQQTLQCGTVIDEATLELMTEQTRRSRQLVNDGLVDFRDDEITYIPVKYHLIGTSNAATYPRVSNILGLHCKLNEEFAEHNIQFYMHNFFNYIESDAAYANPGDVPPVLNQQKDGFAANVYIGSNATPPGGGAIEGGVTLGYYSPGSDWIVLRKDQSVYNSGTFPHEMGHFLSLSHPFSGWDCTSWQTWLSEDSDHGPCAEDNAPCGGVPNELQDGSNCETAGDMVCDTPPDYNFGYDLSGCTYNGNACDPSGAQVEPMENNHMSYFNNCADYEFTPGQVELMMADLQTPQRTYLTFDASVDGGAWSTENITEVTTLISPENGAGTEFSNVELDWENVENAQRYLLQVSLNSAFSLQLQEFVDYQSGAFISGLTPNTEYYWRVKPFNEYSACAPWSASRTFTTGATSTGVQTISSVNAFNVSPNPLAAGSDVTLSLTTNEKFTADIDVISLSGQVLQTIKAQDFRYGDNKVTVSTANLAEGLYFVRINSEKGTMNRKLVVTK